MSLRVDVEPRISLEGARDIVAGTPLTDVVDLLYAYCTEAGLDPAFMLAVARKETQFGVPMENSVGDPPHRNPWGITDHGWLSVARGYDGPGRFAYYYNYHMAGLDFVDLITGYGIGPEIYIPRGRNTVEMIIPVYAPRSENDTALYIHQVVQWMEEWTERFPPGPPEPSLEETVREILCQISDLNRLYGELKARVEALEG